MDPVNVFFTKIGENLSCISCLNVYLTALKFHYSLVHSIARCFCELLDLCGCQPFKLWILNCATIDVKFAMLSSKNWIWNLGFSPQKNYWNQLPTKILEPNNITNACHGWRTLWHQLQSVLLAVVFIQAILNLASVLSTASAASQISSTGLHILSSLPDIYDTRYFRQSLKCTF